MSREEEKAFLVPFFGNAAAGGILVAGEIKKRWINDWVAKLPWLRPAIFSTTSLGGNLLGTSDTRNQTLRRKGSGKKFPETLAPID